MSQYKLLAAYAAGLIADEDKFIDLPFASYGIRKNGEHNPLDEYDAKRITIAGAVRFAYWRLDYPYSAYNKVAQLTYSIAKAKYNLLPRELTHKQALKLLLDIATS